MQCLKKSSIYKFSVFLLCSFSIPLYTTTGYAAEKKDPMAIWPKPENGYQRIAIQLPTLKNEDLYRVELLPEKTMKADCNQIMIGGKIDTKPLTGWGYEYYVLSKINEPASTRMACIPEVIKQKTIIIQTDLPFLRYNSQLPIVVYIPKDIHLSYRIWSAGVLQNTQQK